MANATNVLDDAHAARLAGDREQALRVGIALLEADLKQLGAAFLLAELAIDQDRPFVAGEVAVRLVESFTRRGDLPRAVAAAKVAEAAGESAGVLLAAVAEAFGEGSPRRGDVTPTPPPLPASVAVPPALAGKKGEALLDAAEAALQRFLASDDGAPAEAPVPTLPLFGALKPGPLSQLLGGMTLRELGAEERLIEEGAPGEEAFVVVRGSLAVSRGEGEGRTALAVLGPGAIVGEMALVAEAPRAGSVNAEASAAVLEIRRDVLEAIAKKAPAVGRELSRFCQERMLANLVRHSVILRSVSPEDRQAVVERFTTTHFDAGEALVQEGDDAGSLFLVASGSVEVVGVDADGDALRIAELGPGDVVGEIGLVLRRPANATVRALSPTVALELRREGFQAAIAAHPGLLQELYELATKREEETATVVAQEAIDLEDVVLL